MAGPAPGAREPPWAEKAFGSPARRRRRRALAAFCVFSFIPTRREGSPELSYFNRAAKTENGFTYDAIFRRPEDYDKYLARCDRKYTKCRGLNINEEEKARPVPVLSSSEYGRRINKPLEQPTKDHARANHLHAAIYGESGSI